MAKNVHMQTANEDDAGKRLDIFVVEMLPRLSRAFGAKLIAQGLVLVGGKPAKKTGYKLRAGDDVQIDYDEAQLDEIPTIDLPILYEDDDCVVINKPAGVLTHAQGALSNEATVASFLRDKFTASAADEKNDVDAGNVEASGQMPAEPKAAGGHRTGIVHRLDRATSGVIIGAKNQLALSFLQKQFATRRVKKTYIAIVEGRLETPEAVIDMPIERNPKAPATFRVGVNGKASVTAYKVLAETAQLTMLELTPTTGRTHQLRVHLQAVGHPIIGDPLYGHGAFGDRLFLHAYSLEITLPNRERKIFEAPLPPEFNARMQP